MSDEQGAVSMDAVVNARERQEIDIQVSTAKAYPRALQMFKQEMKALISSSEAVADDCIYAVPRGRSTVEGPSSRLAELVAHSWGNCRVSTRIVSVDGEKVTAQGVFYDIERNVAVSREVSRRIMDRDGNRYNGDMIVMTGNAAASIAARNAVLAGVPKAFWDEFYQLARVMVAGTAETLEKKRALAMETALKFGVTEERVLAKLELTKVEDIKPSHLIILRGLLTAVKDGDATLDQTFPEPGAKPEEESKPATGVAGVLVALEETGSKPEPQTIVASNNPDEPRAVCAALGCTKESAVGSFYCEEHKGNTHAVPRRRRKQEE